jgi:hypothetical protein
MQIPESFSPSPVERTVLMTPPRLLTKTRTAGWKTPRHKNPNLLTSGRSSWVPTLRGKHLAESVTLAITVRRYAPEEKESGQRPGRDRRSSGARGLHPRRHCMGASPSYCANKHATTKRGEGVS